MTRTTFLERWWFSLTLLLVYLGIFHLWMVLGSYRAIMLTGLGTVALMLYFMYHLAKNAYFPTRVDLCLHGFVLLDILLAAVLQKSAANAIYLSAIAYSAVVGGYRYVRLREQDALAADAPEAAGEAPGEMP